jgi:glyoxylase-like metal-dependent hydrolase (beta-lactamase superfamily II)
VDFPPDREVIMSWQTWQAVSADRRSLAFPALLFNDGLTLKIGGHTVILYNLELGHSEGDLLLYLPEAQVLFTSDLAYFESIGYLGEGHMQEWMLALDFMEGLEAKRIVPGYGPVGSARDLVAFRTFMQDFLTAVLDHIEAGDSLETTVKNFSLPAYEKREGYQRFRRSNIERAYLTLRQRLDL